MVHGTANSFPYPSCVYGRSTMIQVRVEIGSYQCPWFVCVITMSCIKSTLAWDFISGLFPSKDPTWAPDSDRFVSNLESILSKYSYIKLVQRIVRIRWKLLWSRWSKFIFFSLLVKGTFPYYFLNCARKKNHSGNSDLFRGFHIIRRMKLCVFAKCAKWNCAHLRNTQIETVLFAEYVKLCIFKQIELAYLWIRGMKLRFLRICWINYALFAKYAE